MTSSAQGFQVENTIATFAMHTQHPTENYRAKPEHQCGNNTLRPDFYFLPFENRKLQSPRP